MLVLVLTRTTGPSETHGSHFWQYRFRDLASCSSTSLIRAVLCIFDPFASIILDPRYQTFPPPASSPISTRTEYRIRPYHRPSPYSKGGNLHPRRTHHDPSPVPTSTVPPCTTHRARRPFPSSPAPLNRTFKQAVIRRDSQRGAVSSAWDSTFDPRP